MSKKLRRITSKDIVLSLPETGETTVVLQRNAKVNRENVPKNKDQSCIINESAEAAKKFAVNTFESLLKDLSASEISSLDVMVVASNPHIGTDNADHHETQRSLDTGREILLGIKKVFSELKLGDNQLLNNTAVESKGVVEISEIKGYNKLSDWPELIEFFTQKAEDTGEDIIDMYLTEAYKDERDRLGVESANSIAKRMEQFMSFSRGSANYHAKNPGRRLIFWAVTHFDTITPYASVALAQPIECTEPIAVEHLGGVTLHIYRDETAKLTILDKTYSTNLHYPIVTA